MKSFFVVEVDGVAQVGIRDREEGQDPNITFWDASISDGTDLYAVVAWVDHTDDDELHFEWPEALQELSDDEKEDLDDLIGGFIQVWAL